MAEWLYLIHPPREDFIATITEDEAAIMRDLHSPYLASLLDAGTLILAGPTWGQPMNDGVAIFEAPDRAAAEAIMNADPAIASGRMTGELREMHIAYLRGRDDVATEDSSPTSD
jgi:uncharacterized protein YciI